MPSLKRSMPEALEVPSLALFVQKPLKVPSFARFVPNSLKMLSIARSVAKLLLIFVVSEFGRSRRPPDGSPPSLSTLYRLVVDSEVRRYDSPS